MGITKIEWCDRVWNPVIGCPRGCNYCYARKMNTRFKWIRNFNVPTLIITKTVEPKKIKRPSVIFMGSTTDVEYWKVDWIDWIKSTMMETPQHRYIVLSKSVQNLSLFCDVSNCWTGYTFHIDGGNMDEEKLSVLAKNSITGNYFANIEPITNFVKCYSALRKAPFVIVGAMTGTGAIKVDKSWLMLLLIQQDVSGQRIFFKDNILKQFPDLKSNIDVKQYLLSK